MSFAAIRSNAYSAMTVAQIKTQVAAANIANADTEGYSVKTANQTTNVTGSISSGVSITGISGSLDKYLLKDIVAATTALGAATVGESYADNLQSLYGSTISDDTGTSLAQSVADLEAALVELAASPDSATLKVEVVEALNTLASQLQETASGVQNLRGQADSEIADSVTNVNAALTSIASLNDQIVAAKARGISTADLEDQRNTALQSLSAEMDIAYFVNDNGAMRVSTNSGTMLVDSNAHLLTYSNAALVTADTVFNAISVDGKNITGEVTSGTMGGLIAERDDILVAAQQELDALAAGLIDAVNSVYASATTTPPTTSMKATTTIAGSDVLAATGTLRVVLTDTDGAATLVEDLDLSAYASMDDLVSALDALDGVSASIDASGYLTIAADDPALGVALGETAVSMDADDTGFSAYMGFNKLLTGSDADTIAVRADILAAPELLATASVNTEAGLSIGDNLLTGTDTLALALKEVLAGGYTFDAAGGLSAGKRSFADYATSMVTGVATDAARATNTLSSRETNLQTLTDALASKTGVNLDEETAKLTELEQYYAVAAQILATLNDMFDELLAVAKAS